MTRTLLIQTVPAIIGVVLALVVPLLRPYVNQIVMRYFGYEGVTQVDIKTDLCLYVYKALGAVLGPIVGYASILQIAFEKNQPEVGVIGFVFVIFLALGLAIPAPFRGKPTLTARLDQKLTPPQNALLSFLGPFVSVCVLMVAVVYGWT